MKDDSLYSVEMLSFHPFSLLKLLFRSFFFTKVDILLLHFILWLSFDAFLRLYML